MQRSRPWGNRHVGSRLPRTVNVCVTAQHLLQAVVNDLVWAWPTLSKLVIYSAILAVFMWSTILYKFRPEACINTCKEYLYSSLYSVSCWLHPALMHCPRRIYSSCPTLDVSSNVSCIHPRLRRCTYAASSAEQNGGGRGVCVSMYPFLYRKQLDTSDVLSGYRYKRWISLYNL